MKIEFPSNKYTEKVYFIGDKQRTKIECKDSSYIMLSCLIRTYPYKGIDDPKLYERIYKIMPYKGIASVYLGDIFEDYFIVPEKLWDIFDFATLKEGQNIFPLYKPLEVDITFQEYDFTTDKLIDKYTITNLRFIRGKYSNIDIFKDRRSVQRSTTNSLFSYSLYEDSPNGELVLSKNKKMLIGVCSFEKALTCLIWKDSQMKIGDTYLFRSHSSDKNLILNYIVKKGLQSFHILWLDDNLALKIKEFTGRFISKLTHSITNNTTISNGYSTNRTIENLKGKEMVINTGFIFKDDISLIHSIIGSAKSWISLDELKTFSSFVCNTKELEFDSEAQLYDFDLEIVLNKEIEDHTSEIPLCPLLTGITYKNEKISDALQSITFYWDELTSSLAEFIYLYIKFPGSDYWSKEQIPLQPSFFSLSLNLGFHSFRFETVGKCENTLSVNALPGFDNIGISNTCPLITGLTYNINIDELGKQYFTFTWDLLNNTQVNTIKFYIKKPGGNWILDMKFPARQTSFSYGNLPLGKYSFRFEAVGKCDNNLSIDDLPGFTNIGEINRNS